MLTKDEHFRFDTIGLQSSFLDDIFRYKYNYLDLVQSGYNLAIQPIDVYRIPFDMNDLHYEFTFRIGLDTRLGLLENFDKKENLFSLFIQNKFKNVIILHKFSIDLQCL